MSLNQGRLKGKIIDVLKVCQSEDTDPNSSRDLLADSLATAIIEEIKEITITYSNGLVAPNGAVTGRLNISIS